MGESERNALLLKIGEIEKRLEDEKMKLDELSENCIALGKYLGSDQDVLLQNKLVEEELINSEKLRKMLEQMDSEEASNEDNPIE